MHPVSHTTSAHTSPARPRQRPPRWRVATPLALITLLLALGGLPAASVHAQGCSFPLTVGNAAQLNAAITCDNGQTTPDEYRITLSGDIALTASTPAITNATGGVSRRLDGAGHTVDGQGTAGVRPFEIGGAHVTIENITITGGHVPPPLASVAVSSTRAR